jgi:hypothetical protein
MTDEVPPGTSKGARYELADRTSPPSVSPPCSSSPFASFRAEHTPTRVVVTVRFGRPPSLATPHPRHVN